MSNNSGHTGSEDVVYEGIAFVGDVLGPLFTEDPQRGKAAALFDAFRTLDADKASNSWPFGSTNEIRASIVLIQQGLADKRESMTEDYRHLFVGPAPKAAPPWGSVYLDRECVVFGKSELNLRAWMRENDIRGTARNKGEPEDHLGRMLVLAAWLARNRPDLMEEYLTTHLLTWAFHFLDLMYTESNHAFYQGLARLTYTSLAGIKDALNLAVEKPRFYR